MSATESWTVDDAWHKELFTIDVIYFGGSLYPPVLIMPNYLFCSPPSPLVMERARPGGGHGIFVLPYDLPISGPEKKTLLN